MGPFLDSVKAVQDNYRLILAILLYIGWGVLIVFAILNRYEDECISDADRSALALGGWPAPVLLISCLFLFLHSFVSPGIAHAGVGVLMTAGTAIALRSLSKRVKLDAALPVLVFLTLVFIRLGFVTNATLPPYFDSAEHYRIVKSLLSGEGFNWPTPSYYHLGYHTITSMLTSFSGASINQVMLIFGQIILAALPMPMYFLVRRATGSRSAAYVALSAAAFGWAMPAHAVNWGKYPAILGLLILQFVAGMAALRSHRMAVGAALAAVLIHTRAIVLITILACGWLFSRLRHSLLIWCVTVLLAVELLVVWRDSALRPILEPYQGWVTLLVVLLAIPALKTFSPFVFGATVMLAGLLAATFIPAGPDLSLIDRPLVEMALYLPLAFLAGLGASRLPKTVNGALVIAIAVHAWMAFDFSPSACCQLAGQDDAAALDWVNKELPEDARLGIAAADLNPASIGAPLENAGTDAGIWVTPLTGRITKPLPYFTDFTKTKTHELLCAENLNHLYVGGTKLSFKMSDWAGYSEWYKVLFTLPQAQIVQVVGC